MKAAKLFVMNALFFSTTFNTIHCKPSNQQPPVKEITRKGQKLTFFLLTISFITSGSLGFYLAKNYLLKHLLQLNIKTMNESAINESFDCSICHETVQKTVKAKKADDPKNISQTACNHLFHTCCLTTWFTTHLDCPICRKQLVKIPPT